ncbi:uncharacterized protein J3R85_020283 [Psidium guajava]|nr:uncharacterized protein J3R85_020283 [Psidium guajava]
MKVLTRESMVFPLFARNAPHLPRPIETEGMLHGTRSMNCSVGIAAREFVTGATV